MVKLAKNLNWDFKIRDYNRTKSKYARQVARLSMYGLRPEDTFPYETIIDENFKDDVIQNVISPPLHYGGSLWFRFYLDKVRDKGILTQSLLRELKSVVNDRTRRRIEEKLVYNGYPKSWATPFYILYYNKINNLMKNITKEIVRDYL